MLSIVAVIVCVCYSIAGFAAFVTFLIMSNYPAAVWGLTTASVTAVATHITWLKHQKKIDNWYTYKELNQIVMAGFVAFTVGTTGFVYHVVVQILSKKPITPVSESSVIPAVWAFMTLKGGCILMRFAGLYRDKQKLEDEQAPLLSG